MTGRTRRLDEEAPPVALEARSSPASPVRPLGEPPAAPPIDLEESRRRLEARQARWIELRTRWKESRRRAGPVAEEASPPTESAP